MAASNNVSAWGNFRRPRGAARPIRRPRRNPKLNLFNGFPAELIAEWCSVAVSTAFAYKSGLPNPNKPAVRLVKLHRNRVVFTPVREGWFATRNAIVDPQGKETPRRVLQIYYLILPYVGALAQRSGDLRKLERWRRCLDAA